MRNRILIALLVAPTLALAGPHRKPPKKKAAPPPKTEEKTDDTAEKTDKTVPTVDMSGGKAADTAGPTAPTTTTPAKGGSTSTPSSPLSSGTKGTTPATTPASTPVTPATPATGAGTGSGSGSAAPVEETTTETKGDAKDVDVDSLRQEYLSLRDELFKSRARANAVASQLYSTRMTIKFTWGSARYYGVSKASIRLDGATVYEDATGAIAGDDGVRFDGYVAPGRHLVTFHVEAIGKDDDTFTSSTESQIVVKAVPNKDLVIGAKGHDNGDIAYGWTRTEKGNYALGIDVGVKTVAGGKK